MEIGAGADPYTPTYAATTPAQPCGPVAAETLGMLPVGGRRRHCRKRGFPGRGVRRLPILPAPPPQVAAGSHVDSHDDDNSEYDDNIDDDGGDDDLHDGL